MPFRAIGPDRFEWITRPHEPDEPARHVAELSEAAGFAHTRGGGLIHVEPGTPLQSVNHGDRDPLVHAYGCPPEREGAEVLDSAP